jgi:putative Ca2+/H+ antiporter (TMEM165/GDT1 family)
MKPLVLLILALTYTTCINKNLIQSSPQISPKSIKQPDTYKQYIESTSSLFFSGLFDRSFFVIAFMAFKYTKMTVFISSTLALTTVGLISVFLGVEITQHIPTVWIDTTAIVLFFGFGIKMILDGMSMSDNAGLDKLEEEVPEILPIGDDNHITNTTCIKLKSMAKIFALIFAAELGDRSQIYLIYLTSEFDKTPICVGVLISQAAVSLLAVFGGQLVSTKVSERTLTILAGFTFLVFGLFALCIMIQEHALIYKVVKLI